MAILDEAKIVLESFAVELENDLINAIKEAGHGGVGGQSAIAGSISYKVFNQNQTLFFELSIADYYKYIDKGTGKATKRSGGGERMAGSLEQWINQRSKLRAVAVQLQSSYDKKTEGGGKVKITRKTPISYLQAQKQLAWMIKKNIHKKGIIKRFGYKGSGFFTKTLNDGRVAKLSEDLGKIFAKEITVNLLEI